jgi:beta,beta-carotene 9',10'-dioxygenase
MRLFGIFSGRLLPLLLWISSVSGRATEEDPINFLDILIDNTEEIESRVLTLDKASQVIPDYVKGSLVRNGPAKWRAGSDYYGHLFDGAAKLTKYHFSDGGQVTFTTKMLDSVVFDSMQESKILPALSIGPVLDIETNEPNVGGIFRIAMSLYNGFFTYDNCAVNVWDYNPADNSNDKALWAVTDSASTVKFSVNNLETSQRGANPKKPRGASHFGREVLLSAHPEYCKKGSGATYNVNTVVSLTGVTLSLVREEDGLSERQVVATLRNVDGSLQLFKGMPYVHSFGLTPNRALVLLQPLRLSLFDVFGILQKGLLRAASIVDKTYLWVIDLDTGDSKLLQVPEPIFFWHFVSATDEADGIHSSIRLIARSDSDYISGADLFMRMDRGQTQEGRNQVTPVGKLVEIRTDGTSATVQWYSYLPAFEYPTHRYSRSVKEGPWNENRHARYIYGMAVRADGGDTFDNWGLVKMNTESSTSDELKVFREPSQYYSEPIFVANPDGETEDDGILLSNVYDGIRRESYLLVLDATTMESIVAKAYTGGYRGTIDFHGGFYDDNAS